MITTLTLAVLKTNESDEDGGNYSITACTGTFIKHKKIDNLTHFQIEIPKRENYYDT